MDRLSALSSQIKPNYTGHRFTPRSTEDVVICGAVRTPLTKSKRGALKDTAPEVLLAHVLKSLVERCKVDPKTIPDIVVGNVA